VTSPSELAGLPLFSVASSVSWHARRHSFSSAAGFELGWVLGLWGYWASWQGAALQGLHHRVIPQFMLQGSDFTK
jgi:hypothetical protein